MNMIVNVSASDSFSLPLLGNINVRVYWGDGQVDTYTTPGIKTHQYTYDGNYTLTIYGSVEQFGNGTDGYPNADKIVSVSSFGDLGLGSTLTSFNGAFYGAINLVSIPQSIPSSVTNLESMFYGASSLNDGNILMWDMTNVNNISYMFFNASSFNQNIFNWNIPININTNKKFVLYGATAFNQVISGWLSNELEHLANHS
jgi:hypothetical protein